MNIWDILILAGIAGILLAAFRSRKKNGSCCSGCSACATCTKKACTCKDAPLQEAGSQKKST